MNDTELLNWLQEQVVDTIYLDDGRIIDVQGGNLREAIEEATTRVVITTEELES